MARANIIDTDLKCDLSQLERRTRTEFIVVHHSATGPDVTIDDIIRMHQDKDWLTVGYHYVLHSDGSIHRGRPKWALGAHAQGNNYRSVGICVIGNTNEAPPSDAQVESLVNLLTDLCNLYSFNPTEQTIRGHRDVEATACPGDSLYAMLPEIRERVKGCL